MNRQSHIPLTDDEREAQIDHCYLELCAASTSTARRRANHKMRELIAQRSAAQIDKMENEQGLNHGRS